MDRAELIEFSDRLAPQLVPIPGAAPDVCPHCHSSKPSDRELCWSCGRVGEFGFACPHVIPISFYSTPADDAPRSPMRERMHDYKDNADPDVRHRAGIELGAIIARYLMEHADALRTVVGEWTHTVVVPAKKHRDVTLAAVVERYADFIGNIAPLLQAGPGEIARSSPHAQGFETTTDVTGMAVLLIDDTFTTGATLHSAAHALGQAGARVVAGLVAARKINPNPQYPHSTQVWQRQLAHGFRFTDRPFWSAR